MDKGFLIGLALLALICAGIVKMPESVEEKSPRRDRIFEQSPVGYSFTIESVEETKPSASKTATKTDKKTVSQVATNKTKAKKQMSTVLSQVISILFILEKLSI